MMRTKVGVVLLLLFALVSPWAVEIGHARWVSSPRAYIKISGEVSAGKSFERGFGAGFRFCLDPSPYGWLIVVREKQASEDISCLTPPFHFVPNPREIEGWHFRNADNSGPNEPGEKNVNAPGLVREFIFSPAVGRTIGGPEAKKQPTEKEVEQVRRFGQGKLKILEYRLGDLEHGKQAKFEWMRFEVDLSWPASFKP